MEEEFGNIDTKRKEGKESFYVNNNKLNFNLLEFWQWGTSDLISNATRGILAEFIVATSLGINEGVRTEWDAFDLQYNGMKIEIKASGYIQSWKQNKHTAPVFGIRPTRAWNPDTNELGSEIKRQADLYVFCLLKHKDQKTINPLHLEQWEFYIISTKKLNSTVGNQKTLSLSRLLKLDPIKVNYEGIKESIDILK